MRLTEESKREHEISAQQAVLTIWLDSICINGKERQGLRPVLWHCLYKQTNSYSSFTIHYNNNWWMLLKKQVTSHFTTTSVLEKLHNLCEGDYWMQ